ncbi:capsid assembly scaffolding protein Gp46 family protein [Streptococcus pluranimalium]|uniref:capsid assembly scaffolding protein Gp46 family protein n=1 Tax=Streptococcus pluranimalium TaxID=82348 RepID=UPI003F6908B3
MAEEHNNPAVDPEQGQNGKASNPPEPEKTVSLAEMQRRLKQAEEKHAQATQEAIAQALEQYKAENELSGKELEEYRKQVAEAEKQKMLDEIDQLKKDKVKRELTDEAIKTLSSRKLPVNDKVLGFVVKDTADGTLQAISDFESIISEIKAEFTQSEPPKTSSSFGGESNKSRADMFRSSRIIN